MPLCLLVSGCGTPSQVTYVDPNGADTRGAVAGDGGEPFITHGADVVERARACIAARGGLAAARTVAVNSTTAASEVVERLVEDDLPVIEPRVVSERPGVARRLRSELESLRDEPPGAVAEYNIAVRGISDDLLRPACDAVVPQGARQDAAFRAAMLHETLQDAATAYEESFDGGRDEVALEEPYRRAYGLLIDASTRQLEAVPEDVRPRLRKQLDAITRRATPGPTPPDKPHDPDLVVGDLAALADEVALAARIDPSYPEPSTDAPDQLRSLKRMLATAVESYERGSAEDALTTLAEADASSFAPASSSIASVSPSLLVDLERDMLVLLPDAIRTGADATSHAGETDARIDEAVSLVEEELELLREDP